MEMTLCFLNNMHAGEVELTCLFWPNVGNRLRRGPNKKNNLDSISPLLSRCVTSPYNIHLSVTTRHVTL